MQLPKFAKKRSESVIRGIDAARSMPLSTLLAGLNIRHVGVRYVQHHVCLCLGAGEWVHGGGHIFQWPHRCLSARLNMRHEGISFVSVVCLFEKGVERGAARCAGLQRIWPFLFGWALQVQAATLSQVQDETTVLQPPPHPLPMCSLQDCKGPGQGVQLGTGAAGGNCRAAAVRAG